MSGKEYCIKLYKCLTNPQIRELEVLKVLPLDARNQIDAYDKGLKTSDFAYNSACLPFLVIRSEQVVGIPKDALIIAFGYARQRFYELVKQNSWTAEEALEVSRTSIVLILIGSENLTAVNARKRLLNHHPKIAPLSLEYRLTNMLVDSRLQHHTKSPLIWNYHRYLVLQRIKMAEKEFQYKEKVKYIESLCRIELQTVFISAEHHPLNYYAWNFARWLFTDLFSSLLSSPAAMYYSSVFSKQYLESIVRKVQKWAFAHAADTSAWGYFQWILFYYVQNTRNTSSSFHGTASPNYFSHKIRYSPLVDNKLLLSCVSEAIQYATSIGPGHEAVWTFLRRVISDVNYIGDSNRASFLSILTSYLKSRKLDKYGKISTNSHQVGNNNSSTISLRSQQEIMLSNQRDRDVYVVESSLNWIKSYLDVSSH
ncbi:uncharacterized protein V1516DRAFT_661454 [Lipomyces oligophaga]|uniref:uncharacterized protein n=1 Tax=Lipomyces oligophaga TaxID=45792 RepID=UPI0034CF1DCF